MNIHQPVDQDVSHLFSHLRINNFCVLFLGKGSHVVYDLFVIVVNGILVLFF
jgi:hypothetical protein